MCTPLKIYLLIIAQNAYFCKVMTGGFCGKVVEFILLVV